MADTTVILIFTILSMFATITVGVVIEHHLHIVMKLIKGEEIDDD